MANKLTFIFFLIYFKDTGIYPCVDRSDDCAMFASQDGYCQYHKRYMMSMCAKSCSFCSKYTNTLVLTTFVLIWIMGWPWVWWRYLKGNPRILVCACVVHSASQLVFQRHVGGVDFLFSMWYGLGMDWHHLSNHLRSWLLQLSRSWYMFWQVLDKSISISWKT